MLSAIGSSSYASPAGTGKPAAGLETQLAQYQVKLADWVNCPSCKTPEGKARIQQISDKISDIKQRLEVADAARQGGNSIISSIKVNGAERIAPASSSPTGSLGTRVDVFA